MPSYDPFRATHPPQGCDHAPSYWAATAGPTPGDDGPLEADADCDVAIVGAGYTGLSAALHLARDHGIAATVLEAGPVAWGCSGRNGSFARASGGRLGLAAAAKRQGMEAARGLFTEMRAGLDTVRGLIADNGIECDRQPDGVLKVAHRARKLAALEAEATFLTETMGYRVDLLSAEAVAEQGHAGPEAHGAISYPDGFGMHPLKLAHGYLAAARALGARVHPSSAVTRWETTSDNRHRLRLGTGAAVTARRLIVATNGYGGERVFPFLRARLMPVISQIIVTEPLSPGQEADAGFTTRACVIDTRTLLHYYRRLPDGRVMFGGRGGISGNDIGAPRFRERLRQSLEAKFPALRGIGVAYDWAGWVAITADHLPHVVSVEGGPPAYVAAGYSGSGVSFATQAGLRLAEIVAGRRSSHPVAMVGRRAPAFPLAAFRRPGQRLFYAGWRLLDERS